nr:E3 ubiquitin-protein ligase MARCHF3-like [Dermacentor andersoni]
MDAAAWSKDAQLPSLRSPEAISDSEDESTGYLDESGSSRLTCWICHEGDEEDPLVSPCSCSGTMGFVHVSCLEHWRNEQNVGYCELCGQPFHVAAQPKSMFWFLHYVWQSEGHQRLALLSDLFYLAMVTSAIVFSLVMLVAALGGIQSEGVVWRFAIVVLVGSAFLAYCLQCSFQMVRNQYHSFSTWHFANPARRFVAEPSVREVNVGQTERNDAREAGEPSTCDRRCLR